MADPLRLVVYVNGIRFWPSNVSVSCPGDDLPTFTVEVPAVPEWRLLPARSHVAVFFSDPVTKIWRLLVEGEYEGWDHQRLATGVRRMSLRCRSLHAFWETTTYANAMASYGQDTGQSNGVVDLQRTAQLNGQIIQPSQNKNFQVASLNKLLSDTLTPDTRVSEFLMQLLGRIVLQTPVECFYSQARGTSQKMFCFQDKEIANAASQTIFKSIIGDRMNSMGFGPMDPIKQIYQRYESAVFYRHVGIVAPPIYSGSIIPELLFLPHLYNIVPPVCNVVFRDQIQGSSPSRSFLLEPSRVVGMLQYPGGPGTLPPYYMVNNSYESSRADQNTPANSVSPGMGMTHGSFTEEDFIGGVRLHKVDLRFEKVTPATAGVTEKAATAGLLTYIDAAMRHAFAIEKGNARTASYHCSFMPYIQPGFPCLIEDGDIPVHGFIERVEHQISPTSQPCTIIMVTQIREAYVVQGLNRTPPLPTWMNSHFLPKNIDTTYQKLFGPNNVSGVLGARGAMVNGPQLVTETLPRLPVGANADQVNMDALAGLVIPVPQYDDQYILQGPVTAITIADRLRASADTQNAMLAFQYRAGTSLWQYSVMHNLDTGYASLRRPDLASFAAASSVDDSSTLNDASNDPPEDLSPSTANDIDSDGHPMFGHPLGMQMTKSADATPVVSYPPGQKATQYGVYELVAEGFLTQSLISPMRQQIARMIAESLRPGITSNG